MNRPQLIQEIKAGGFEQYDEAGLIDIQSLNRWIKIELSKFGGNIMLGNEKTIKVINGRAELPENFWKLDLAIRVDLEGISGSGDREEFLQDLRFTKERREVDVVWDNASDSYQFSNYKCIEEAIYFSRSTVKFRYGNPRFLKLTKGFNKEKVSPKCHNLSQEFTHSDYNEINITGNYINTNFPDGYIYIQYSGLELDESGELVIPECNHNAISDYLISYCRWRILEDLVLGDDKDKIGLLKYWMERQKNDREAAERDAKWYGARGWKKAMKQSMARHVQMYENMLPSR